MTPPQGARYRNTGFFFAASGGEWTCTKRLIPHHGQKSGPRIFFRNRDLPPFRARLGTCIQRKYGARRSPPLKLRCKNVIPVFHAPMALFTRNNLRRVALADDVEILIGQDVLPIPVFRVISAWFLSHQKHGAFFSRTPQRIPGP